MSADSVGHVEGGAVAGRDGFRKMQAAFLSALPDIRIHIEEILAEGERVAVRWRATGTHGGDGFGFPATRRPVDFRGTTWMIVRDGRVVEGWDTWNFHGLLNSLQTSEMAAPAKALF